MRLRPLAVECSYCNLQIKRSRLSFHWRENCAKIPPRLDSQHVCTLCQAIKEKSLFYVDPKLIGGMGHRCKACNKIDGKAWKVRHKAEFPTKPRRRFIKPSSWVLIPCKFCGEVFATKEMRKHLTFCPKKTGSKPWKITNTTQPLSNMEEIQKVHMATPSQRQAKRRSLSFYYGMTIEQYDAMLCEQAGKCAICQKSDSGANHGHAPWLHVDHDHATGSVRGLLCTQCNHLLGNCRDNPGLLIAAISYLAKYSPCAVVS